MRVGVAWGAARTVAFAVQTLPPMAAGSVVVIVPVPVVVDEVAVETANEAVVAPAGIENDAGTLNAVLEEATVTVVAAGCAFEIVIVTT